MQVFLMNKDIQVMKLEFEVNKNLFNKVIQIKNIEYSPLSIYKTYQNNKDVLTEVNKWFKGRNIPIWRDDLFYLLKRLDIKTADELLMKSYALSLSDQYWIKPCKSKLKYKDVNFFENDFGYSDFLDITFSKSNIKRKINLMTPNNTTDGRLKKTWVIENNKRILVKGGYKDNPNAPLNEYLASMICMYLGIKHVKYELDVINKKLVSKCEDFIDEDTELITAHSILKDDLTGNYKDIYEKYIKILESNGISDARDNLEDMVLLDYLIMNVDRHLNNLGIIRDVNTLRWLRVAPIFDSGEAMNIDMLDDNTMVINENGRLFNEVVHFDKFLELIRKTRKYDFERLEKVVDEFEKILKKYQSISKMNNQDIYNLCYLLYLRIQKAKDILFLVNT